MLLPSAGSIAVYNASDEVVWCSDGYERPDLRALLDRLRAASSSTLAGRGNVEQTADGVPALVAALRGADACPLGALVVELGRSSRHTPSMVVSMLRPVLDCLESHMDIARSARPTEKPDTGSLDLLLSVDEDDREDASALQQLLRHCVQHLGCVMGALLVPDKNLAVTSALDASLGGSQLLDRTQKHLLAWAQLNNRPMVVNRVGSSGDVAPYKILSCPVRDLHGRVIGLMALFRAATAEDFELRDIRILEFVSRKAVGILNSHHDALTGLINRFIFERRVQTLLDTATGEGHSLLYVDIDKLESINQAFGFHAGDEVIQRVADVIRRVAGPSATASRIGGDRFAVLLPEADLAAATEVGKRILGAVAQLGYITGVDTVPVTASIGVAAVGERHERVAHLLAAAELASKRAKQQGRNRVVSDEGGQPLPAGRQRQLLAAASLQEALKSNEFRLEAQPIVGLGRRAGDVVGYELLVRMRNSAGELLAPDKFLDAAERYELLPALDRWVLCSAVDVLRPHAAHVAGAPYCFTINVSAQSLANRKYADFALEQLAQAGCRRPPLFRDQGSGGRQPHCDRGDVHSRSDVGRLQDCTRRFRLRAELARAPQTAAGSLPEDRRALRAAHSGGSNRGIDRIRDCPRRQDARCGRNRRACRDGGHGGQAARARRGFRTRLLLWSPAALCLGGGRVRQPTGCPGDDQTLTGDGRSTAHPYSVLGFCQIAPGAMMLKRSLLAILLCGCVAVAAAETAYVTDSLRLGIHEAPDTSDRPFDNLVSGTAVDVLDRNTNYARVRLGDGREGWVKGTYLVELKPAQARLAELEAEIAALKNEAAAAKEAQRTAEAELAKLGHEVATTTGSAEAIQDPVGRLQRENQAYERRLESYRRSLPLQWVGAALIVALVGGFVAGLWWLDALIRRRHGGFRIY
jgi:SH3 domain protein